jgi:putative restriction endonuclease
LVLALFYYCQIPFAKTKSNNPKVQELASIIGRSPASVARKLGNFGAFDPALAMRGIIGLSHYSMADEQTWTEFNGRWDSLVEEAGRIIAAEHADTEQEGEQNELRIPTGPSEWIALKKTRRHQAFFRQSVLSSYESLCAICGLDIQALLIASHIVPWAAMQSLRSDPRNGLCLCSIHDCAFDQGLIAVSEDRRILVAELLRRSAAPATMSFLLAFEGAPLTMPTRFLPDDRNLAWHRENIFTA